MGGLNTFEAEQRVLGSILIDPDIFGEVARKIPLSDFRSEHNQRIYQAALMLYRMGQTVDPITIRNKVGSSYTQYMAELMEITATSSNIWEYAKIMHEQTTLARMQEQAQKILDAVELEDCRPVAATMEKLLSDGKELDAWNMQEMLDSFMAAQDPDAPKPTYIGYGLPAVDERTTSQRGDVVVIGGYPSDGKTALSLMMAYAMAKDHKVGYFSLETSKEKLRDRMLAFTAQIGMDRIKHHDLSERDWKSILQISDDFTDRDLTIIPAAGSTVMDIASISKAYGFEIVYIDYVQLIKSYGGNRYNRTEQMAEVSRELHTFAQTSGTMVVELAQLSRPEKSSGWKAPTMHDLKESSQFEQDADLIFLLYRPNPKDKTLSQKENRILQVVKNKEGSLGSWPMHLDGKRQTFSVVVTATEEILEKEQQQKEAARLEAMQMGIHEIQDTGDMPF